MKFFNINLNSFFKKTMAFIYYAFCLLLFILSCLSKPNIEVGTYDLVIYKLSNILISISFLMLPLLSKINGKSVKLKKNQRLRSVIFVFIFLSFLLGGVLTKYFHTNDYLSRSTDYNQKEFFDIEKYIKDLFSKFYNNENTIDTFNDENSNDILKVHFIDVGQGDSIFLELPNKETMLIDAGEKSERETVSRYIENLGYEDIEYLIATHPHSDHIGGLYFIVENFEIGNIYMPKAISNSKTYENLINTISAKNLKINNVKSGFSILNENNLKMYVVAPNKDEYSSLNDYSVVLKVVYKENCFLFTGDMEIESESEISSDIACEVVKVAHHGSDTSSSIDFVKKTRADYAIISVGEGNSYNHPVKKIVDRWKSIGADVYRTDINGNIVISSNGENISVVTEK